MAEELTACCVCGGKPAAGHYCRDCLSRETEGLSNEDMEAMESVYRRLETEPDKSGLLKGGI